MSIFRMPSLGSDMEAGTLAEWLVEPGDTVARGDVIAVVETQKGAIEIETFEAGVVSALLAEVGQTLPVGAEMARIGEEGEAPAPGTAASAEPVPEKPAPEPAPAPDVPETPARPPAPPPAPGDALRASPAARQAAAAKGVDLSRITGSGPGGAIVLADVEGSETKAKAAPTASPLTEMRKAVAAAMVRSKQEIPHFYVSASIDTQALTDWLATLNADRPAAQRILPGAAIVKAAALAAKSVKALNGHYDNGAFHGADTVNTGVAIALRGGGLVAPALADVDAMTLDEVMAGMRDMVTRARAGRLRSSEMTRGTITVSSLGESGADSMTGVIFPPQVALLAVGAPQTRPWVVDGAVLPRAVTQFTLSADHRVCDGRQGSKFLTVLAEKLSAPEAL